MAGVNVIEVIYSILLNKLNIDNKENLGDTLNKILNELDDLKTAESNTILEDYKTTLKDIKNNFEKKIKNPKLKLVEIDKLLDSSSFNPNNNLQLKNIIPEEHLNALYTHPSVKHASMLDELKNVLNILKIKKEYEVHKSGE